MATTGRESEMSIFIGRIAGILSGLGLLELNTYNLSGMDKENARMRQKNDLVELESSVSEDYTHLRISMIPSLLEVFSNNRHNDYPQKVFDAGTIFIKDKSTETGVRERTRLCASICAADSNYTAIRQILDYLLSSLGCEKGLRISGIQNDSFIPGRIGKIMLGREEIGIIGEIHPEVLGNFRLGLPVSCFEIDLILLLKIIKG